VARNDVTGRSRRPAAAAAAAEFTTYDVTEIQLYASDDGQRLDTTEMMVTASCSHISAFLYYSDTPETYKTNY